MKLVNIYATNREVFLFLRESPAYLDILIDDSFYPFKYLEDPNGRYKTYDGKRARRIYGNMYNFGKRGIYENDVNMTKRYLIEKVSKIEISPIRYVFFDIEILMKNTDKFDDVVAKASRPVSCITLYDNATDKYQTFFLGDYKGKQEQREARLLNDFITAINEIKPDLLLAWNVGFDYEYLYKRIKGMNFAESISPVNMTRWAGDDLDFPVGISVLDYMEMYRKYTQNKAYSYSLDAVLDAELGRGKEHKFLEFNKITKELKERNIEDVVGMVNLEKKMDLIGYYDAIRRMTKTQWEDLPSKTIKKDNKFQTFSNNSRIIDMLCLEEAKKMKIVLPSKRKMDKRESFDGAYREAFKRGMISDTLQKLDLTSAYPTAIVDFCLDTTNITEYAEKDAIKINGIYFKQDPDKLLPRVAGKMLKFKAEIKEKLKNIPVNDKNRKRMEQEYSSVKGIVNSTFGVIGLSSFRLFDVRVPNTITFLIKDLLKYVISGLSDLGYEVVYADTDSVLVNTKEDILDLCNELIQKWGKEKYGKSHINIEFEKEGEFEKLLILAKCRYIGHLKTEKGMKTEIKGVEMIRKDSSAFMRQFQKDFFDFLFELEDQKIEKKEKEERVHKWIVYQMLKFFEANVKDIAFPVRYKNKEYKNVPVFLKALNNTLKILPAFKKHLRKKGFYYYIYDKQLGAIAFDEGYEDIIREIDWQKMIERNILNKIATIYSVLGYDFAKPVLLFNKMKGTDLIIPKPLMKKYKEKLEKNSISA